MKIKMSSASVRTQGDGTEHPDVTTTEVRSKGVVRKGSSVDADKIDKLGKDYLSKQTTSSILYDPRPSDNQNYNYPPPVQPKGKRFYLIPKLVKQSELPQASLKNRKLNLILMEPYKACVNPIFPYKKHENRVKVQSRNNLDINDLVRHVNFNANEATKGAAADTPFEQLKKERDFFESQLKFQTQVNTELKGLLVHCLGEDLQAKVNNLTEDKMKIAKSLSTNTEQIEFLASQSEVWRSKFLASSLMVEELAKVKTSLAQRTSMLITSNKQMLSTFERIRFDLIETFQNLKFLSEVHETNLKSLNVLDLTSECLNISQQIVLNSGKIGLPSTSNFDQLETLTDAEKNALRAVAESNELNSQTEEAFRAVCNQAHQEYQRKKSQAGNDFQVVEK